MMRDSRRGYRLRAAGRVPQSERALAGRGGFTRPVKQRQLIGQTVVQARRRDVVGLGRPSYGPLELRGRFPV
jgi:hypothetical protein